MVFEPERPWTTGSPMPKEGPMAKFFPGAIVGALVLLGCKGTGTDHTGGNGGQIRRQPHAAASPACGPAARAHSRTG